MRTLGLIEATAAAGHDVLLVEPGATGGDVPAGTTRLNLPLLTGAAGLLAKARPPHPLRSARPERKGLAEARARVRSFRPDLAVVSEVHARVLADALLPPGLPYVYDAHNAEGALYAALRAGAEGLVDRATFAVDERRVRAAERALLQRAAGVLVVSPEDADLLRETARLDEVLVVPSSVPLPPAPVDPAAAGPVILLVGSLHYPPNAAALARLLDVIVPALHAAGTDCTLVVAGRGPSKALRAHMASRPWCTFLEDLPDLSACYRSARCVVLPISTGGGSRLKVYEALAAGVPVVATRAAVAGVPVRAPEHVLLADDDAGLCAAARSVLTDDDEAARLGAAGRELFERELAWPVASRELDGWLRARSRQRGSSRA